MQSNREVAIVGYACRVPGASNSDAFWRLLQDNHCSVGSITPDRFATETFRHPSQNQFGRSYTFAAGVLDDVWGFDANAFGMSPREAEQVDPQHRHLLEVTYDALAHSGIRPSLLGGSDTGVYIGASSVDYAARFFADPSAADVHMMTGNSLSIMANRLSYTLDLKGPSLAIDTACSSSLVALHMAAEAIRNNVVDTAIVGGVNLVLSPFSYIGFSRASMLSPTGLCRPFDAGADGYVRAEAAIVVVLRSLSAARKAGNRIHSVVVASGMNQDGRTTGLALPSADSQRLLLEQVYDRFAIDPADLSFVEAHGTGTPVGDPIEADALGRGLAQQRSHPLLIGSVKSNIGHTEPVSGLAGMLKSMLALHNGVVPATLHQQSPNPNIDFDELNLEVVKRNFTLPKRREPHLAGINSFGFGGTNAHAVLRSDRSVVGFVQVPAGASPPPLLLSAHSPEALSALAASYVAAWPTDARHAHALIGAAAHLRDALPHRLIAQGGSCEGTRVLLENFVRGQRPPGVYTERATGTDLPVAFLFSGNGSQWVGMGRDAWETSPAFRQALKDIDRRFAELQHWSIVDLLFDDDLASHLRKATYSQPLLFAVQAATVGALEEKGLAPSLTLGHSVGEIAAAWAAGALTLEQALRVVSARSRHQEVARGLGHMAALMLSEREARRFLDRVNARGIEIAAINSWRSITIAGPPEAIDAVLAAASTARISARRLDLDYPFHSALIDPVREPLLQELKGMQAQTPRLRFVSSVTGQLSGAEKLDAEYWWRNVRSRVQFESALNTALKEGIRVFIEIGPKPVLGSYVRDVLREAGKDGVMLETLTEPGNDHRDPIERCVLRTAVAGGQANQRKLFGRAAPTAIDLPLYPWQHAQFKVSPTVEADTLLEPVPHLLLGRKRRIDSREWYSTLDPTLYPWMTDHKVGTTAVLPAAAYVEILLAAASEIGEAPLELRDLDIVRPLTFDGHTSFETKVELSSDTGTATLLSRPRGGAGDWMLNARGIVGRSPIAGKVLQLDAIDTGAVVVPKPSVYAWARKLGLDYGPSFQRVNQVVFPEPKFAVATLDRREKLLAGTGVLDVTALDGAFHALFASEEAGVADMPMKRMLPIRFGRVRVYEAGVVVTKVTARTRRQSLSSMVVDIDLWSADDRIVVSAEDVRLVEAPADLRADRRSLSYRMAAWRLDEPGAPASVAFSRPLPALSGAERSPDAERLGEGLLLLEAGSLRAAWAAAVQFNEARAPAAAAGEAEWPAFARSALLYHLSAHKLVEENSSGQIVKSECELPDAASITESLLVRHADMALESASLSRFEGLVDRMMAGDPSLPGELSALHWKQLNQAAAQVLRLRDAVRTRLSASLAECAGDRLLRVLMIGADHVTVATDLCQQFTNLEITLTDFEDDRLEQARATLGEDAPQVRCVAWPQLADLEAGALDAAFAIDALSEIAAHRGGLDAVTRLLRPDALLVAAELSPGIFWDIVRGTRPSWWSRSATAEFPVGALLTAREWLDELDHAGFSQASAQPVMGEARLGVILSAVVDRKQDIPAAPAAPAFRWVGRAADALRNVLKQQFEVSFVDPEAAAPDAVLAFDVPTLSDTPTSGLGDILEAIASLCRSLTDETRRLWILLEFPESASVPLQDPYWCAITSALRVVQNEYAGVDIRCIGLLGGDRPRQLARIATEMVVPGEERELAFCGSERIVFRVQRDVSAADGPAHRRDDEVLRLARPQGLGRGALTWAPHPRRAPEADEVEIEVAATGLNFRDVMWNLRLLPEEALEDGYAGAGLGMEAAGTILRVGENVRQFVPGDRVVAFVPQAFASHVVAPAFAVSHLPADLSFAAAATIPVAFLTAYYSLVHLGQLRSGESVLIHGGAGAVGLAALQIAKHLGATTIATAGSEEKRALLRNLGVDLVCSSRSLAFAEEIRTFTGGAGVDVVLNSLAGDAMIRSLECLKPFGRFIELGKRDFYANTFIGLRPMRRNLSYFGVDVDQLIGHQRDLATRLFGELLTLFADGTLIPLPHRVFAGNQASEAFQLMLRSGHIGKIVVEPGAHSSALDVGVGTFPVDRDGLHVVIGGTRGFGLATAQWLVDRGACHLALLSRTGRVSDEDALQIAALRARNIDVSVAAIDASDATALSSFIARANETRPIKGIVTTAMVLKDQLIQGLDRQSIEEVLRPKVDTAVILEKIAASLELDYLLMFSSATTFFGNPGQFNYVAANAFVDGMARRMRARGLPALAVAWGAIEDAGFIARNIQSDANLKKRFASTLLPAQTALAGLDWSVDAKGRLTTDAYAVARVDWAVAKRELGAVRTPTFRAIDTAAAARQGGSAAVTIEKLRALPPDEAADAVLDIVVDEIARVLRLPPKEIDRHRPLAEIGMDSLMMLELRNVVEESLSVALPMMSLASGITPADVARRIVALVANDDPIGAVPGPIVALASSHFATDVQKTATDEQLAAVDAVLERAKQLDGPP